MLNADDARKPTPELAEGDVDAHSHIWTPDVAAYPLANGNTVENLGPRSFTAEELLAIANPLGITRVVLIQHRPYHGVDNSYILDSISKHPGVFSAVSCIDETAHGADGAGIAEEMDRLKQMGTRGIRIRPGEGGTKDWKDSPPLRAMWEHAAESGIAICPLINPEDLPQVDRMCEVYPESNVVVDHFARIGVDGKIRKRDLDQLCRLARHKKTYVKLSAFYALGEKKPPYDDLKPMIGRLIAEYGPERLMWASDNPYQLSPPNTYAASLDLIKNRCDFLSADDKTWVLRKTAEQVFFAS